MSESIECIPNVRWPLMLTGDQIRDARRKAGFRSAVAFAAAIGWNKNVITRAEAGGSEIADLRTPVMLRILVVLEQHGVFLDPVQVDKTMITVIIKKEVPK
jgi:ribosome-binding protein aMBF1 (putative translation factor)